MFHEMNKFYKTTAVVISFVLAVAFSIGIPILFINQYISVEYSNGKEVEISGLDGLEHEKEQIEKFNGILSTDKLNEALDYCKAHKEEGELNTNMQEKYPWYLSLLSDAYTPYGTNSFDITKLSNADDFYMKNVDRVKEKMDILGDKSLSATEREEVLNKADNINKPYNIEFADQWAILIKSLLFVYIVILLSAMLISSRLFSFEKENNMSIILNSAGKRKLISIGYKKILAMISYLSIEFIVCTAITAAIVLGRVGMSGWDSQIQILPQFFTIIYNWTIGEMIIHYLIIAFISILAIALIGALINAIIQETYTSLIISAIILISPIFLRNSVLVSGVIQRYLYIQPINGISLLHFIDNLFIYKIGSIRSLSAYVIFANSIIYFIIGLVVTPVVFSKRIRERS